MTVEKWTNKIFNEIGDESSAAYHIYCMGRWGQWNTFFTLFSPHSSSQTLAITVSPVRHKNNSVNRISEIFIPIHSLRN
jgi:hypothetical protein